MNKKFIGAAAALIAMPGLLAGCRDKPAPAAPTPSGQVAKIAVEYLP